MNDSNLISGLYPKVKHPNAPDWVLSKGSINVQQFREWMRGYLKENPGAEWINYEIRESKAGKQYASVDDWKPTKETPPAKPQQAAAVGDDFGDSDIPF